MTFVETLKTDPRLAKKDEPSTLQQGNGNRTLLGGLIVGLATLALILWLKKDESRDDSMKEDSPIGTL